MDSRQKCNPYPDDGIILISSLSYLFRSVYSKFRWINWDLLSSEEEEKRVDEMQDGVQDGGDKMAGFHQCHMTIILSSILLPGVI